MDSQSKQIYFRHCWKQMIIITIIVCFATTSIIIQYRNGKYKISVSSHSQARISYYLQHNIHLVLVSANNKYNEMTINVIKSAIFHRRKSYNLTFHIFTDSEGQKSIGKYFNSTEKVCIKIRLYQIESVLDIGQRFLKKHRISSTHYSGIYAFSKAFIHEVLPSNISHIILIDTDVLFLDDIYSIWEQFHSFKRGKTVLGLVPWYPSLPIDYKYKGSNPDLYLTGVVLLDLNVSRSINLTQLFSRVTETASKQFGLSSLWTADQVILSLFAMYFPEYVVALPCFVNGHTYHYLTDGSTWKSACSGQYPRNVHVVPSSRLTEKTDYFGHLYVFFKDMPTEWLLYCVEERFLN